MQDSPAMRQTQEGVDPRRESSPAFPWKPQAGWACLDVKRLRMGGCCLQAIGLAAAMTSRDDTASTEERIRTVYGLDRIQSNRLLRELIVSGFLDMRGGLYHIGDDFRAGR